ncbi:trypsin-like serine protease, partial [Salmonella sp. s54925]|uniref:trypsin-like serine protease n=1 Tax=Salmonella sp. s54925 TaxID=3159674 RepID=UPI00398053AD
TGAFISKNDLSKVLKQVKIPFIKNQECAKKVQKKLKSGFKYWYFNSTTQFCAADKNGKNDTCYGDDGGPAMVLVKDVKSGRWAWSQVGIVSWGNGCAQKGEYGYYTKVSAFLDWIDETINE